MILSAEKRLISIPTANAHASCVARVGGETWLTWFGGTREGAPDVKIYLARERDGAWTQPVRISADESLPHWNPVLLPKEGGALLYFKVGLSVPEWRTMVVALDRDGRPLTAPRELAPGDVGGRGPVRNKCLRLPDGRLLAPASTERREATAEQPVRWTPMIDISEDDGLTFARSAVIPIAPARPGTGEGAVPPPLAVGGTEGNALPLDPCLVRRQGAIQPALWCTEDGRIHLLMRSSEGCLLRSDSPDGETWTPAARTGLPNNNSGIDLVRMEDGRVVLCLNPVADDWGARTPLWLCVSRDDGDSFAPLMALESAPGEYSYPSLASEGNRLFLSYTWKRLAIAVWEIRLEQR